MHGIFLKTQYKCAEVIWIPILTHSFSFSVNPLFLRISQPPGYNQPNGKQYWLTPLSFKINLKDTSFRISINSWRLYLSPECLLSFLWNLYICIMIGNNFQIYGVRIPRKYIELRHFFSCPSWLKTRPQVSCQHTLGRRKLLIHSDNIFSKICFPQQGKERK